MTLPDINSLTPGDMLLINYNGVFYSLMIITRQKKCTTPAHPGCNVTEEYGYECVTFSKGNVEHGIVVDGLFDCGLDIIYLPFEDR